jgi:phage terminase small subunit
MQLKKQDIREIRFVRYYLSDPQANKKNAAVLAGYAESTANKMAANLLRRASVQSLLRKFSEYAEKRTGITRAHVLNELARLGFANMQDYIQVDGERIKIDLSAMTRNEAAAIQELTIEETAEGKGKNRRPVTRTKLKLANKREALELLGRHLKLFEQDTQGPGVAVILVDIPRPGGRNLTNPAPALPEKAGEHD